MNILVLSKMRGIGNHERHEKHEQNTKKEGGVPAVNKADLIKLKIPLPSFNEQARMLLSFPQAGIRKFGNLFVSFVPFVVKKEPQ